VSVRIILRFNLDKSFGVSESSTFGAMSQFSGLSVMNVKRIVRHAILNHRCFQEKKPGIITHSALTAILSGDDLVRNAMIVQLEEFCPAGMKVSQTRPCSPAQVLTERGGRCFAEVAKFGGEQRNGVCDYLNEQYLR
jgi:hypothetical protein